MRTVRLAVDPGRPQPDVVSQAATVLTAGGVVAFPTETVYGLGANALDAEAVARIFTAKGRPSNNPLIVHTTSVADARRLCRDWPLDADKLADEFWPGPLTLVLPKADCVPSIVTAGGPTVAIRVPDHPVARALIEAAGVPLAAPSANLSTRVSAVRAEHVLKMLDGRIEMVLDGGPTSGGLESTVVDLSHDQPRILRPGLVAADRIAAALGKGVIGFAAHASADENSSLPSPGLMRKHYSPLVPVDLIDGDSTRRTESWIASSESIGWLSLTPGQPQPAESSRLVWIAMPAEPERYAERLYDVLHELELRGVARIVVERPPATAAWEAINDRLRRAAARDT
ncbi:MAG: threonylcarbamoyl-AMP synthase [Planctomycetales bacterium]|nr:threonylcarbamoyl-AMP synthase [Planctomycetales bacterium]MBN8625088.1 threonylcarbamoyl-AMP synthase [Planctomycetota bacterium]